MNFNKFINSDYLKDNPLCGINTYKDELNLATGACTRKIKKYIFDGTEGWQRTVNGAYYLSSGVTPMTDFWHDLSITSVNSHFVAQENVTGSISVADNKSAFYGGSALSTNEYYIGARSIATLEEFTQYLSDQYTNGTPVTIWYILASPTTETITVPSGLSGIEEGYLIQDGTPTSTNPIYPTANTVEKWFDLNHYIHNTSTDTLTTLPADIYANDTTATVGLKGNTSQQSGTTTVSSKSVTVSSLESGTNYALFPKADFPNAVVGDTINIVVSGTSYAQKVMKIDASYVYIENRTV